MQQTKTENYLFTKEPIQENLEHLTDEGALIIVAHSLTKSVRLMITTLAALPAGARCKYCGCHESNRIYVFGHSMTWLFVLNKRPLTAEKATMLHGGMHGCSFNSQISKCYTNDQGYVSSR